MTIDGVELSFSEAAGAISFFAGLCSIAVWALSTRFVTKKAFYFMRDKDAAAVKERTLHVDLQLGAIRELADECNNKHALAAQPAHNLAESVEKLDATIERMNISLDKRHDEFMSALAKMDTRIAVVEDRTKNHGRR